MPGHICTWDRLMLPDHIESDTSVYVPRRGSRGNPEVSSVDLAHVRGPILFEVRTLCRERISVKCFLLDQATFNSGVQRWGFSNSRRVGIWTTDNCAMLGRIRSPSNLLFFLDFKLARFFPRPSSLCVQFGDNLNIFKNEVNPWNNYFWSSAFCLSPLAL